ncbi:MAG TPA: pseudouridine synthase, partial [Rhodoplanes sp.]|nr:pseudouridine synthase [Rhodoplanes sp.]
PALNVTHADKIVVDGKPLPGAERTRLFLYNKPRGLVTTTSDPQGRPTIFGALPKDLPRLISVGRLDLSTEGLLLLTNDGGLARVLELPATGWLRRYRVRAHGQVDQAALDRLREGLTVDGVRYGPIEASLDREQGANVWLTMAIREGKNREVRNVVEALGLQANRLIRVSFGPFHLGEMQEGEIVEVKTRVLRDQLGDRIAAEAGCDFTGPVLVRAADEAPPAPPRRGDRPHRAERNQARGRFERPERDRPRQRPERDGAKRPQRDGAKRPPRPGERGRAERDVPDKPAGRPRRGHAWRAEDAPLSRHYRGAGSKARELPEGSAGPKRAGLIADRKGRRVLVERFGEKASAKPEQARARPVKQANKSLDKPSGKPRRGRPESRDRPRGAGPRPSRPKSRPR